MKCRSEYEVRKKDFSRLSAQQVSDYGLAWIPANLADDGHVILDTYHQMGGDRAALQESISGCQTIEERSSAVLVNTSNWLLTKGYCLDEALMNQITCNFIAGDSNKRKHEGESSRRPEKLKVYKKSQILEKANSTAIVLVPLSNEASPMSTHSTSAAPEPQEDVVPPLNPTSFVFSPQPLRSSPPPAEKLKAQMAEFEKVLSLDNSEDDSHNTVANSDAAESEHERVVHSVTSHSSRSNFSSWLALQTVPEAREEINLEEHDLQLLLSLGGNDRRPKVAKVTSRLIIEESGQKFAELTVPAEGKQKGELTAADISVTKVPLGQTTTEGLKQDTQTLINALFLKLDKEKAEKTKLQEQVSQLCEIIAKVAKPSSQPVLAHEQVSNHLIEEVEDAGNQVTAINEWKSQIIHQASKQLKEVPTSLEVMKSALSQLKQLMTDIVDENAVAEGNLDILVKINKLPEEVLIAEQLVLDGLIEKGKQLEFAVSFRMEILKLMLKRMQLLEDRILSLPGNIVAFTKEEVVGDVSSYRRVIPNKVLVSLEGLLLMIQKRIDEVVKTFTLNSINKLITLQSDIKEFGPSLKEVEVSIDILSKGLL
ncbi:hypothetical protein KI387_044208 [Taxus chinensis]|uniref:Uncharacterized protein n=1 Tax=Taxus chinensis TaxID=29808 RepID=A0AA38KVN8_TAXCH|nr:hypothetical protein KI387_044208 [Taxus chinensis]